ncbi:hypothetical protein GIB67_036831 [Kingdonia uniflora]|uniref:Bifunctional inhibitor/plant lipid transfer protein/seed storage helical domain-containing protein n=1 Tax=Kingdonia uniflora TaxID=39325 RepID=A0A7J7LX12_9MAGN|nr:hypothetical protein GIB67_036831 [Kingdonia uniflora]
MASSSSSLLILVIFVSFPSVAFTQDPFSSSTSSGSDMLNCGPQLLALAPCASFVQGSIPSPSQTCCNNLYDLFDQQPNCLCVLLNETSFTSFPINRTLAFQLPNLCRVAMNISSACPGLTILPGSPESQTSPGPNANSSAVACSDYMVHCVLALLLGVCVLI